MFADTLEYGVRPPKAFTIITDSTQVEYAGTHFAVRSVPGPSPYLDSDTFPCIIYGLDAEDLERTYIWASIEEAEMMLGFYQRVGLAGGCRPCLRSLIEEAKDFFSRGMYVGARQKAIPARNQIYLICEQEVWPLVEAASKNPRAGPIPLRLLNLFSSARRHLGRAAHLMRREHFSRR